MFKSKLQNITIILGVLFVFSGCVYPAYITTQPSSTIYVVDGQSQAIEGAKVYLFSSLHHGFLESNSSKETSKEGIANFEQKKEWYLESLMIHGRHSFYWNWCIEKEGFESKFTGSLNHGDFKKNAKFILRKGTSSKCLSPHEVGYSEIIRIENQTID